MGTEPARLGIVRGLNDAFWSDDRQVGRSMLERQIFERNQISLMFCVDPAVHT